MKTGYPPRVVRATIGKITPKPERYPIEMHCPISLEELKRFVDENRGTDPLKVIRQDSCSGQTLAICGAGPSLKTNLPEGVDQIWACNSALTYLLGRGVTVSAGVGIDQTPGLLREWLDAPDVPYLLASTVSPAVVQHLRSHGRDVTFFHSYVGFQGEFEHYCETWPPTLMAARGYMVVSRMISVAEWMGFARIDVYGCDCALEGDVAHANGELVTEAYKNPLIMRAEIDGREWKSRPDMLIGAVDLVRRSRESQGKIRLIGDTLPNALMEKDEAFLDSVMKVYKPGEPLPT
jgi:hypothetical protein